MKKSILLLFFSIILFSLSITASQRFEYTDVEQCRNRGDQGYDPLTRGYIEGQFNKEDFRADDYCYNEDVLYEFSCQLINETSLLYPHSRSIAVRQAVFCEGGCLNGVCQPYNEPLCQDTDEGLNYNQSGRITIQRHPRWDDVLKRFTPQIFTDRCLSPTQLQEWYCSMNNTPASVTYECPYRCERGACRPLACAEYNERLRSSDQECCRPYTVKEDLWSTSNPPLAICCRQNECAADAICFRSGTEMDDARCVNGRWYRKR
ncbi:TPA: hypothetical protein HA241_02805 [Candidatus Woesearchaeota archaeon]|nr:hypothetical protein [Candidatus Woesearchaeota archaeon]